MESKVGSADLESRTNGSTIFKFLLPVALVASIGIPLGLVGYSWKQHSEIKKNLAPNGLYIRSTALGDTSQDFQVAGVNEDVNGDGIYESVLKFVNPLTRQVESRIIERDSNNIRLRKYEIVNGQIRYLSE